jgi:WXG100 family type VII secretion target
MPNIKADTAAIHQAGSQFSSQAAQLAELIQQVGRDISNLQPLWEGPAASQFEALMMQWRTDVNGIQQVLEQVSAKVQQAGTGYEDLEGQIRQGFQL